MLHVYHPSSDSFSVFTCQQNMGAIAAFAFDSASGRLIVGGNLPTNEGGVFLFPIEALGKGVYEQGTIPIYSVDG